MYAPLLVLFIWSMMNLSTVCCNVNSFMVDDDSVQCTGGIFYAVVLLAFDMNDCTFMLRPARVYYN